MPAERTGEYKKRQLAALFLACLVTASASHSEHCLKEKPPLVCAHGGDAFAAPPNTIEAFQAALNFGAKCVEVDVARTSDGELVVLHNRDLAKLLGGRRAQVGDLALERIRALQYRKGGERVAMVAAVLQLIIPATDHIILDVKLMVRGGRAVDLEPMAAAVAGLVRNLSCGECLVWSKSDALVERVAQLAPELRAGYIVVGDTPQARAAGLARPLRLPTAQVVGVHHAMVSDALTGMARGAGQRVYAWTANSPAAMSAMLDAGVDAVITNHPRRLARLLDERLERCLARAARASASVAVTA